MKKITVYCEAKEGIISETSYELISKAFELKNFAKNINDIEVKIQSVLISDIAEEDSIQKIYSAGSDSFVHIKNNDFNQFNQIVFANAFLSYFNENYADYILFPATLTGRMVAPRITTMLNTGLVADCTAINFLLNENELKLASTRPTFGSELMATILCGHLPECATIRPKTFKANFNNGNSGEFIEFPCSISNPYDFKLIESTHNISKKINLQNAKIIFAAGFGLYDGKDNEYVEKLYAITQKLDIGFALSRKLVDFKVMSNEYQVGQTGTTVTPDLYVAFGISGAIQHISGMKNSAKIIAINTDEDADIFKYADYKIVADAKKVIDEIAENL